MDRDYVIFKCDHCLFEVSKSFYSAGDDWRCGVDLQAENARRERAVQDSICPACNTGRLNRKNWMFDRKCAAAELKPNDFFDMIKKGADCWNQWRKENPAIDPTLNGLDLRSLNFENVNLAYANLENAIFAGMDLKGIFDFEYFKESNTDVIKLRGANMTCVNISDAYFTSSDFRNVDLQCADLRNTFFYKVDFGDADLKSADIRNSVFKDCYLRNTDFSDCKFYKTKIVNSGITISPGKGRVWPTDNCICSHVMTGVNGDVREPMSGDFAAGEFSRFVCFCK